VGEGGGDDPPPSQAGGADGQEAVFRDRDVSSPGPRESSLEHIISVTYVMTVTIVLILVTLPTQRSTALGISSTQVHR